MPPPLPDELLEEIFLRLPPDEPAWLVRASLASKLWLGLLTGPAFRGRYREFHGAAPMLGFFHSCSSDCGGPPFVPTAKFGAGLEDSIAWHKDYNVCDCRHGRLLLCNKDMPPLLLVAWDPMTGPQRELRAPQDYHGYAAAVFCNVTGCNHRACHEGPISVLLVGVENGGAGSVAYAHVSLPEVGEWSKPCVGLDLAAEDAFFVDKPPVSIQDALYFLCTYGFDDEDNADDIFVLKYDVGSHCLTLIDAPPVPAGDTILVAMEDGGLGFASLVGFTLHVWSRQMGSDGVPAWTLPRVMDLNYLLPIQNRWSLESWRLMNRVRLIGSVEGRDIVFVTADLGTYEISLKSLRWKKIWKRDTFLTLIPYMSFYGQPERAISCDAAH